MSCTDVLSRWFAEQTPLACIAELRPGPAMIRMPSCRLALEHEPLLRSAAGSVVVLPDVSDAEVETDWRGTRVEVTTPHGSVTIADYDCPATRKEVLSH